AARLLLLRREPLLRVVDVGQHAPAALQVVPPLLGQRDPPRRAVEQPHAEPPLERRQRPHYRRQRGAEGVGGGGQAAAIDDAGKGAHGVELVHDGRLLQFPEQSYTLAPIYSAGCSAENERAETDRLRKGGAMKARLLSSVCLAAALAVPGVAGADVV